MIEKRIDHDYVRWLTGRYCDLTQNISSNLPSGLIHGDLFCYNALFEGKQLKAILDFKDVCHYYKVFDIGKASSVLSGYQKIRPLEGAEREVLQAFSELAAILTSIWRFWKYNIDLPGTQKSNKYLEMVHITRQIAAIPKTVFLD